MRAGYYGMSHVSVSIRCMVDICRGYLTSDGAAHTCR